MIKLPLRICEIAVVGAALAILGIKGARNGAYEKYIGDGGTKSFWSWIAADPQTLADELALCASRRTAAAKAEAERAKETVEARRKAARARAESLGALERRAQALREKIRRSDAAAKRQDEEWKRRRAELAKRSGGAVRTKGKSSYVAGGERTPYRVNGIRGIEFGSTENAPGPNVKPLLSVSYDDNGNMVFEGLKWRENKRLTDPVYGFDRAYLDHSFESEQLSSVIFNKSFPFTEQGLQDAMAFYEKMSREAADDLGFEAVTRDRTGNLKSANICGFTNKGGDTTISGGINAWGEKNLTVTLRVSDNACSTVTKAQSDAAYASGLADTVDARVDVWKRDYTANKIRVNEYLGK